MSCRPLCDTGDRRLPSPKGHEEVWEGKCGS